MQCGKVSRTGAERMRIEIGKIGNEKYAHCTYFTALLSSPHLHYMREQSERLDGRKEGGKIK